MAWSQIRSPQLLSLYEAGEAWDWRQLRVCGSGSLIIYISVLMLRYFIGVALILNKHTRDKILIQLLLQKLSL